MNKQLKELKKACIDKDTTITQLAKQIGCSTEAVYYFLRGKIKNPRKKFVEYINKILNG